MIFAFATFAVGAGNPSTPRDTENDAPVPVPCASADSFREVCTRGSGHGSVRIAREDDRPDSSELGAEGRAVKTNYRPCA
jgi:hypothetical protein